VEAALDVRWPIEALFVDQHFVDQSLVRRARSMGVPIAVCDAGVLARALTAETPQPLAAVVRLPLGGLDAVAPTGTVVVLDELRDPGNVGTIIRSATAFGATAVILTGHSVDPFNPKALRASAGACFRLPVIADVALQEVAQWFKGHGTLVGTVVNGGNDPHDALTGEAVALVLGSESHGLSDAALALCDRVVTIAMLPSTESLNVAVAASVLLHEAFGATRRRADGSSRPSI
jgi:TrmH family RNA methyltransferase